MLKKRFVIAACLLSGMIGAPAVASSLHLTVGGHGHNHGQQSCTWRGHAYAGTLLINGCRTVIRSDCDVRSEILRAFQRAGYHACFDRGSLVVSYRGCARPNIRWYGESTGARFSWGHSSVRIGLFNQSCNACSGHGGHGGHDHAHPGRGWNDRGRHWNRHDSRRGRTYRRNTCG